MIGAMTDDERRRLVASWWSPAIRDLRERYVALGRSLVTAPAGPQRSAVLDEQREMPRKFRPAELVALSTGGACSWLMLGKRATGATRCGTMIRTSPDRNSFVTPGSEV